MLPLRDGVAASSVTLPSTGWEYLLDFLCDKFTAIPREVWLTRLNQGLVTDAQGNILNAETAFQANSIVRYYRALEHETQIPFEAHILFQDKYLIAVDKPHFLPAVPAGKYLQETLLVRLKKQTGIDELSPMHRIDRETAGVMVFVVKPETRGAYQCLFQNKLVRKQYHAIAAYREEINLPLTYQSRLQVSEHFMRMQEISGLVNSETRIELIERSGNLAKYSLTPLTGKKHQLRVHMMSLGIPVVNDQIYPEYIATENESFEKPLQLLAKKIEFADPFSGEQRIFQSNKELNILKF